MPIPTYWVTICPPTTYSVGFIAAPFNHLLDKFPADAASTRDKVHFLEKLWAEYTSRRFAHKFPEPSLFHWKRLFHTYYDHKHHIDIYKERLSGWVWGDFFQLSPLLSPKTPKNRLIGLENDRFSVKMGGKKWKTGDFDHLYGGFCPKCGAFCVFLGSKTHFLCPDRVKNTPTTKGENPTGFLRTPRGGGERYQKLSRWLRTWR